MKIILPLLVLFCFTAHAQTADFILLKKGGKTLKTIYADNDISITTTNGNYLTAHINAIKNDSLFLQQYIIRYLPTTLGTYIVDTAGSYRYIYHYNQIMAIGKAQKKGFDIKGSGGALFGGGVVLTVASGVVWLVDRNKFSAPLLIAAAGLGTAGYFMAKGGSSGMVIGKKGYKLVYMDMSNNKK